jgi:MFS family permease
MGWYRGLASAAFALGAVSGGWLADQSSISLTLVLCAGLYLVAGLVSLLLKESPLTAYKPRATEAVQAPNLRLRAFLFGEIGLPLFFMAGVILWTGAHSASASMWPNYMASLGYTKTANGWLWGMAALIEFPAMRITGGLSDTLGRAPLLMAGGLGITLTNLGYWLLAGFLPLLVTTQVVRGFGFGSYTGNAMTYATEIGDPATRGSRSGLFNATSSAGSLLGTFLGGAVAQNFGFGALYATCAALALGSAFCFLLLHLQRSRQVTAEARL